MTNMYKLWGCIYLLTLVVGIEVNMKDVSRLEE